jgi:RNA polymerase nonessential primary-like sigma factor
VLTDLAANESDAAAIAAYFDRPDAEDFESSDAPDATRLYLEEIGAAALLTPAEEVRFARQARRGIEAGRKRMIESNLRLVVRIARRYLNRGLSILDLVEEGNLGLIHAVEKFDPELGYRFSTYATWWIRQAIERAIMNQSRTIRLPVHVVKDLNTVLRAARELAQKLDHEPTPDDIASLLGRPVDEVEQLLHANERIESMDQTGPYDRSLAETLADERAPDPRATVEHEDLNCTLERLISTLSRKQQEVLARRFGLRGYRPATLEQVGEEIGLTRERVRQIQLEALGQLRASLIEEGLDDMTLLG